MPQGSLEVPCQLTFRGDEPAVEKVRKLLHDKPKDQLIMKEVVKTQKTIEKVVKAKQPHSSKQNSVGDTTLLNLNAIEKSKITVGSEVKEPVASGTGKTKVSEVIMKNKCEEVLYVAGGSDNCLSDDKVVWLKMCRI